MVLRVHCCLLENAIGKAQELLALRNHRKERVVVIQAEMSLT